MRNLRGTYVHRGDAMRRRIRIQRLLMLAGVVTAAAILVINRNPGDANAEVTPEARTSAFSFSLTSESRRLKDELETTRGELDLVKAQLERSSRILNFSTRYKIGGDMAAAVFDIALAEGIDPELAFRLVRLESGFNERATSPVGAVGLTQLMVPTANYFQRGITRERLYDRKTNLRIGFRYLRTLIKQYDGDTKLALLVYNRGEVAVKKALDAGVSPTNGYDKVLTKGYRGTGVVN
jgi:soluble lytic murein transglycosylase-like protein